MNLNDIIFTQGISSKIEYSYEPILEYDKTSIDGTTRHVQYLFINDELQFRQTFKFIIADVSDSEALQLDAIDGNNDVTFQAYDDQDTFTCSCSLNAFWYIKEGQEVKSYDITLDVRSLASLFPAEANLVHYWNFDTNGNYNEVRGNITGILSGTLPYNSSGKSNGCYAFGGADQINCTPTTGLSGEKCISFWVNGNKPSGSIEYVFFDGPANIGIRFDSAGIVFGKVGATYQGRDLSNWINGVWNLIVINFDFNGEISGTRVNNVDEIQNGAGNHASGPNMVIGAYNSGVWKLNRSLDELAIWDKQLSSDEMDSLWNSGAGIFYTP